MKRVLPLIALIPFIGSYSVSGHFGFPYALLVILLTVVISVGSNDSKRFILGAFWTSAIPVVWTLSEVREGRTVWDFSLPASLALAALATSLALAKGLDKPHVPWVVAAILTWCVCYFGGSSGSADEMKPYFSFWRLSPETLKALIIGLRKLIHVVFYATLAHQIFRAFGKFPITIATAAAIALCDEWRQGLMPNRYGSFWDVLLDLSGASLWLWLRFFRGRSASASARAENAPQ